MFKSGLDEQQREIIHNAIGQSDAFLSFQENLSRVAGVDRPVLIIGERGTGKELAAQRIHYLSERWQEPLMALNCAALAPTLIESELFGHEAGAFTGATRMRTGRFEAANGGSIFLDELGNIPIQVQEKILRAVEYGAFERVGGAEQVQVDVRIIGATNADLPTLAQTGRFMQDLLDRLSFDVVYVPPLRARQEDIMLLANHFAAHMARDLGRKQTPEFDEEAVRQLESHPWRGNIRELKNVVERAVYQSEGDAINNIIFDPFASVYREGILAEAGKKIPSYYDKQRIAAEIDDNCQEITFPLPSHVADAPIDFKTATAAYEIALIQESLQVTRFNQREAARRLRLSYNQFRGLYRKYQAELQEDDGDGDEDCNDDDESV